jgi:hypothetical protein
MRKFTVTIDRTVNEIRTITVKAENKEQARAIANDIADSNEGWEGKEYCVESSIHIEEVPNDYIDRYGNPYDCEDPNACWPAGGGLHKDCEFNADALYAYYVVKSREKIFEYLTSKGFVLLQAVNGLQEWAKGNTRITFEDYDNGAHLWGYLHTEVVDDNE